MKHLRNQLSEDEMRLAWRRRDAAYDGLFYFGVTTTGIFCRPSCPSRPRAEHLQFFRSLKDAIEAGFRPCRRCEPDRPVGKPPDWIVRLMDDVKTRPGERITTQQLRSWGLAPERVRRWFQRHHGVTFTAWCRAQRLSRAFEELRDGKRLDFVAMDHGFESHSGFRSAFLRVFGRPPGRVHEADCLRVALLDTPLGSMLAAVSSIAVVHLEFVTMDDLEREHQELRRRFHLIVIPGANPVMKRLRTELDEYFCGKRREFSVPLSIAGTAFQLRVWNALRGIPHGTTWSYEDLARQIGAPSAVRAVARANAANRIHLLIPCHRVIRKDGCLSGYAGGVWRKESLLQVEACESTSPPLPNHS